MLTERGVYEIMGNGKWESGMVKLMPFVVMIPNTFYDAMMDDTARIIMDRIFGL
jgi:hypothetical protein